MRPRLRILLLSWTCLGGSLFGAGCGVNTDQPVYPLVTLTAVGAPAISAVSPVTTFNANLDLVMQFDLQYYLTNAEDGFLGYNLYIRTSSSAAEATILGTGGTPYLPEGTSPSFPHVGSPPDTTNLVSQRITHYRPPPGETLFDTCDQYFFRLTAVIRTGAESLPSPEVGACAIVDTTLCPKGTVCNP